METRTRERRAATTAPAHDTYPDGNGYREHEIAGRDWAVPSTATIAKHPIHPMLIPIPITSLLGALATDIAFWWTDDAFWARAALWLTGIGVLSGLVAAIPGLIDFVTIRRVREHSIAWGHMIGNVAVMILAATSWFLRLGDAAAAVIPWGLTISLINALILTVTGWLGGELSYRHRVGVMRDES